ncbi:hypothetical protein HO581_08395 [Streptococcus suis]|uniref:hypothetical protein n=1 Tax=Streptococcus suis TaxID=1307 RepID=UPI001552B2A7|nr:hypothetical protein [Streptococcus suis]MCB2952620.1 hypothetical protein [Streptococcus suis]MCK3860638.1 hypothetical protein [Streptococcus suis]MCK3928096.1 hypothetical protein [Streptococcus suis]MCK3980681.1 hypothetical protein [Streptococcus suis]MCK4014299.1 hypothetical protein [Streptococcus suis]
MSNKTCFVVTAIGQAGSQERIHADKVLTYLIEPVCSELNIQVIRVDRETTNGDINESILNHLKNDDLVIADLTWHNANAFYEFGYRQALGLPVVPIIKHDQRLPFDVISKRTVFYDTDVSTIEDSKSKLKNMILDFENFIMPNKRDETKSELEIIIEKLDLIIEQTRSQKTSSLSDYNSFSNETNKVLADAREILANQPKFNFDSTTNPHLQHNLGDTE